jgi:hypothetical protein
MSISEPYIRSIPLHKFEYKKIQLTTSEITYLWNNSRKKHVCHLFIRNSTWTTMRKNPGFHSEE